MTDDPLRNYLRSLAAPSQAPAPSDAHTVEQWREANRPLISRLRDLLASIPIEVQRDGLALRILQTKLIGRSRKGKMCDHAELGAALRSLGFRRDRRWSQPEQGFRAVWKLED